MVAKDYPFYLTVKRANCSLEVPPSSSPAKDAEVRASPCTSRGRAAPSPSDSDGLDPLAGCLCACFTVGSALSRSFPYPRVGLSRRVCPRCGASGPASLPLPPAPSRAPSPLPPSRSLLALSLPLILCRSPAGTFLDPISRSRCQSYHESVGFVWRELGGQKGGGSLGEPAGVSHLSGLAALQLFGR